jgi:hypothetical protein
MKEVAATANTTITNAAGWFRGWLWTEQRYYVAEWFGAGKTLM